MTGRFITFEGGEGTGKSTQAALLSAKLTQSGVQNIITREPGGTPGSEEIRELLVRGDPDRWNPMSELCLLNAARSEHVERVIRPALSRGWWVICDRYVDSTFVYQGHAKGVDFGVIDAMHRLITSDLFPDLTLVLDITVADAFERIVHRASEEDRFESHEAIFQYKVADGFRQLAKSGGRYRSVDGTGFPAQVATRVWALVIAAAEDWTRDNAQP